MKNSKNFSSYDELINYYGSVENIPSNVLAVVEDQGSQVLFSVSNNLSQSGEQYNEGGYNLDEEDREKLDYSYTTVQEIELSYASKDYVSDYVSSHAPQVDLTGYATESYVVGKIEDVVGVAPAALDTLKEIADSLNNDADFAGTMTVALSNKADKSELNSYVKTTSLESMGYATQSYVVDYVSTYGGGEDNVQADWNITDSTLDSYIKNKPCVYVGGNTKAVGIANSDSNVKGQYSFGAGDNIETKNLGEVGFGKYNKSHKASDTFGNAGNTLFSVGNGEYIPRKNALEIMQNGDLFAYNIGNYDGINLNGAYTLAYVIGNQEDRITYLENNQGGGSSVQADWGENDPLEASYILNKPVILNNDYYTFRADGDNYPEEIKAALFETFEDTGDPATEMHLSTSDYNWFDNQYAEDGDGEIILGQFNGFFEIDTDTKTARIKNVPAGNYMILFSKQNTTDSAQGEFSLSYNYGNDTIMTRYTVDNQSLDSIYFHPEHSGEVLFSWSTPDSRYANFFFDKDVEYFEITTIPGDSEGQDRFGINIKYKEYATLDYIDELIGSAADLAETIVGENDSNDSNDSNDR